MPPANDNFASAEVISGANGTTSGTCLDATREGSESSGLPGGTGACSVWYKYTAASTGWYKFHFDNLVYVGSPAVSNVIGDVHIFPDGALSAMTAANAIGRANAVDDAPHEMSMAANLTSGNVYYIRVSAVQNASTYTFDLTWDEIVDIAPANDLFANRIDVGSVPTLDTVTFKDSIIETSEPNNAGGTGEQSVWYSFTPASTGTYLIEIDESSITYEGTYPPISSPSFFLQIGTGASASAFSELHEITYFGQTFNPRKYVDLTSGTEYKIRIGAAFTLKSTSVDTSYNAKAYSFDFNITQAPSAPANDNFANAETLVGASGSTTGTTLQATNEGEPTIGTANAQSVWYKYTPAADGMYTFKIPQATLVDEGDTGSGSVRFMIFRETVDTVAEATRANQLPSDFGFDDDTVSTTGGSDADLKVQLYSGNTYYLRAASNANSAVTNDSVVSFDLEWDFITGPANDNLANAVAFGPAPDDITGQTTKDACAEEDELGDWGDGDDQSVWYEFTPSSSSIYRFSIDNIIADSDSGTRNLGLALYDGGPTMAALNRIDRTGTSDDSITQLALRAPLTASTTYYLKVYAPNNDFNNMHTYDFDVHVEEITSPGIPPANDDIADAQDLGDDPSGLFTGSTIDATYEVFEGDDGYDEPSVWYKFTITGDRDQTISLTKTGTDPDWEPYAEIYSVLNDPPTSFADLEFYQYIGNDTQTPTYADTDVSFVAGDYYLVVYNWNFDNSWDDFDLEFEEFFPPPVNDAFNGRTILPTSWAVEIEGTTLGATDQSSEPNLQPGNIAAPYASVWYQWTSAVDSSTDFDITVDGGSGNTRLMVYTGSSIGSLSLQESDHNSGPGGTSAVTLTSTGFTTYRIRVASTIGTETDFTLRILAVTGGTPPANDDWEDAELMTGYSDTVTGTTADATSEFGEPGGGFSDESTNTVWYKWTPPQTGRVRLELQSDTVDGDGITVFTFRGTTLENLVEIEGMGFSSFDTLEYTYFSVESGHDYYFKIQGENGYEDTFTFSFEMANVAIPANDNFANATVLDVDTLTGSITTPTEGANFDSAGPYEGDYVTDADINITLWWKFTPTRRGRIYLEVIDSTGHSESDFSYDAEIEMYTGDSLESLTSVGIQLRDPDHPSAAFSGEVQVDPGQTYYILQNTYTWSIDIQLDYAFAWQTEVLGPGGFQPSTGNGLSDFTSTTGGFAADDEDGEFVASGAVSYGTIEPWANDDDQHYPYGWWCRFDVRSTSGDYLYRYGQSQQHIEIFRATKASGEYHSIVIIGHSNGEQTIGAYKNGAAFVVDPGSAYLVGDTGYRAWGAKKHSTSEHIRVEVGTNGVCIDGRSIYNPNQFNPIFQDTADDQFVSFDFGIRSYPTDGTSYVDLDPEWNFRYSNIRIHDDPTVNVMGSADSGAQEVTSLHGVTTGSFVMGTNISSWRVAATQNVPVVVVSEGDYDGYSIDCSEDSTAGNNVFPCGVGMTTTGPPSSIYWNFYTDPAQDSYFPGLSFRFYVTEYPSQDIVIAQITGPEANGTYLWLETDGTLSIQPSRYVDRIPFCTADLEVYYQIELQADTSVRKYATRIWMNDNYLGRYECPNIPLQHPNQPPQWNSYLIGKLGSATSLFQATTIGLHVRDICTTRRKQDRPLGPTIIVGKDLMADGTHNYERPDPLEPGVSSFTFNSDFSGGTDGSGQPHYWTGWSRDDAGIPANAMYLGYLFGSTFENSLLTVVSETSGPPGMESDLAMQVDITENGGEACYVFGGGTEPATDVQYTYQYADTISFWAWMKGDAGKTVFAESKSGTGGWFETNRHTLSGDWEFVRLYMLPQYGFGGGTNIFSMNIVFENSVIGDQFWIKDANFYVNAEGNPPAFYESTDGGSTHARIEPGDTDTYNRINDFPPTASSDQIYTNTASMIHHIRGREDDGKTHMPPAMSDAYLEWLFGAVESEDNPQVFGAAIQAAFKGYSGDSNTSTSEAGTGSFAGGVQGAYTILMAANESGEHRWMGAHVAKIHIDDPTEKKLPIQMPRPPGNGEWNLSRWNEFAIRLMTHNSLSISTTIAGNYTNAGLVTGLWAEVLQYDRRLFPPPCVRPIDLSRVRFRAYQTEEEEED